MPFVYEPIPPEDEWRFDKLSKDSKKWTMKRFWIIDRERDFFCVYKSARENARWLREAGQETQPYYLFCFRGLFFGLEITKKYPVDYETDEKGRVTASQYLFRRGLLYIPEDAFDRKDELVGLAKEALTKYQLMEAERFEEEGIYAPGMVQATKVDIEITRYMSVPPDQANHLGVW